MCLNNKPDDVKQFLKKNKSYVYAYKVVVKVLYGYQAPYLHSILFGKKYKPGINKSNSRAKSVCTFYKDIENGIHVYLDLQKAATCITWSGRRVVKVRCDIKDLIGVNLLEKEAVFSKVFLSVEDYNNAIK